MSTGMFERNWHQKMVSVCGGEIGHCHKLATYENADRPGYGKKHLQNRAEPIREIVNSWKT
jgi:hypothetical protein